MAMDALVAELELNIDSSQQDLYDNRLSFPTSQREVGGGKATAGIKIVQSNSLYDKRREPQEIAGNNKLPRVSSARDRDQSTNEINKMMMKTFQTQSIETNSERERHEDRDRIAVWQKQKEAMSSASLEQLEKPHYGPVDRNPSTTARAARGAFQTINEEKLNPSRV